MIYFTDYETIAAFHGHSCPGLTIGYRVALSAMEKIKAERAANGDELVVIAENNSCAVDAVQFISGCTTGKGNLIIEDYGKFVFTWFNKSNGESLRVYADVSDLSPFFSIRDKITDPAEFKEQMAEAAQKIMDAPEDTFMTFSNPAMKAPEKAMIEPSIVCFQCGEKTMASRMIEKEGKDLCSSCWLGKS